MTINQYTEGLETIASEEWLKNLLIFNLQKE